MISLARTFRVGSALSMLLMVGALGACGGSSDSPTAATTPPGGTTGGNTGSTSTSITVADNSFSPSATTVAAGSTVTWTWAGSNPHNVAFDDGSGVKSATQASGTYQRTFATAGTYPYHCTVHGVAMSGTITVK